MSYRKRGFEKEKRLKMQATRRDTFQDSVIQTWIPDIFGVPKIPGGQYKKKDI
jgi:hypothetical protein